MAGFSTQDLISSLVASTNAANKALLAGSEGLTKSTDAAQALMDSSTQALRQSIDTGREVQAKQAEIDYTQQKTVEDLQSLYNMNPAEQNNEIAQNLAVANRAREERAGVRQEYDRLNQVDFLTNPVGYLFAQLQLPTVAKKNNALADAEDNALAEIQTRTSLLNASKSTVVANTADAVKATKLQMADVNAQQANARLDQAQAENIVRLSSSRMQALQLVDKTTDNQRSTIATIAQLQNAEETRLMRAEQQEDRSIDRELRREQLRLIIEKKKQDAAEEASLNERLQVVSNSLGLKLPMTLDRIKGLTDKDAQEAWLTAATTGRFGRNLRDSVVFYQQKGNLPDIAAKGDRSVIQTAQQLDRTGATYVGPVTTAYRAANPAGKPLNDLQARELAYDQYSAEVAQSMGNPGAQADLSAPKWDRTFNPYVAQFVGFSKAIDALPEFAGLKNNLVKKQIDTLVGADVVKGENLTSEQQKQVLAAVQAQVAARGVTSAKAAADISQFMKAAADYNLRANKYNLFALPTQQNYLFSMEDVGRADLFDPVAVERKIVEGVRKKMATQVNLFNDPGSLGMIPVR